MTALWPVPFVLDRHTDITGISSTGVVAVGVVWPDGRVSLRWDTGAPPAGYTRPVCQVEHFETTVELMAVHGHAGATVMRLGDPLAAEPASAPGVQLFAVVAAATVDEIWWWGVQWRDGPAVTWRVATRYRRHHTPQLTLWPDGCAAALAELTDGVWPGSVRVAWLPDEVVMLAAILPKPALPKKVSPGG